MEGLENDQDISDRMKVLVDGLRLLRPQAEWTPSVKSSYRFDARLLKLTGREWTWALYWLCRLDSDCRLADTKLEGPSVYEKAAIHDLIAHCSELSNLSYVDIFQLSTFPDFILVYDDIEIARVEIVRVTHQAVEEAVKTNLQECWQSGKPFKLNSNTPIVRHNNPDRRYNPSLVDRKVKDSGCFGEWIEMKDLLQQIIGRSVELLSRKIDRFVAASSTMQKSGREIVILDFSLNSYGLGLKQDSKNLTLIGDAIRARVASDPKTISWLNGGGVIRIRVDRLNEQEPPYMRCFENCPLS